MTLKSWAKTDVGLKREINQDSILIDEDLGLYIVADGMGGHKGGEVASALAVSTMQDFLRLKKKNRDLAKPRETLIEAFSQASRIIHHKAAVESPELMGMGTTMVAIFRVGNHLYVANVGDSRAYLWSDGQLFRMTEDHSIIYEQIRAGLIDENDLSEISGRNVITRSVGFEKDVQVDVVERELQPNDRFLLCSDGLCGLVPDKRIGDVITTVDPEKVVGQCIQDAKRAGGDDNISVIYIKASP